MKVFTILFLLFSTLFTLSAEIIQYEDMDQVMTLADEKATVLFFKADWCPSCKSAAKKFAEDEEQFKDIYLVVVNYDTSKKLQKKYGVTYQHTFVQVSPTGDEIVKWNGGAVDELLKNIDRGDM